MNGNGGVQDGDWEAALAESSPSFSRLTSRASDSERFLDSERARRKAVTRLQLRRPQNATPYDSTSRHSRAARPLQFRDSEDSEDSEVRRLLPVLCPFFCPFASG